MHVKRALGKKSGLIVGGWLVACVAGVLAGCSEPQGLRQSRVAGESADGRWWMRETALTADGLLDLRSKPWWERAQALPVGEGFVVPAEGPAKDRMFVRRERITTRAGKQMDAIVWIIDDNEDGSALTGGDLHSDCYVVDYDGDGLVDRMVDWIDNDDDGIPDEMDIRYFRDGRLNYCWFGMDLDGDGHMWSLTGYEYGGPSFFEADPHGDNMIYMNKFNPQTGTWYPISECPFAFYDMDGDGLSEVVVRVSAVPLEYDPSAHPDYANNQYAMPWGPEMERMGVINIRYGFDVDNGNSPERPLHYEMGFNLVGAEPYDFRGMRHHNPRRRPPQTTCVIPHNRLRAVSDRFPAKETGFSWHEHYDDTIAIGHGPWTQEDWRWEGVFWIWERRFMENTGGPCQKWNVRREWRGSPTDRRELYYSGVDRRIHLRGATEGWTQVGHFAGQDELFEIRTLDTDGNGYLDRWEVWSPDSPVPIRVTNVRDEKVERIALDYDRLVQRYTEQILPEAMAANERLLAAMSRLRAFDVPVGLAEALNEGSANHRRYVQDVIREFQYQDLRWHLQEQAHEVIRKAKMDDLRPLPAEKRRSIWNSQTAWQVIRKLQELEIAYGEGEYERACAILAELESVTAGVRSEK